MKFSAFLEFVQKFFQHCTSHPLAQTLVFKRMQSLRAWLVYFLALLVLGVVMLWLGWVLAPQIRPDPDSSDQGAYAYLARDMQNAAWPAITDGVRNPLFPWLVAKFVKPTFKEHAEIAAYLIPGKRFNAALATLITLLIGLLAAYYLPPLPAWNVAAVSGLACLLPIASYFGAEPIFYGLNFGVWFLGVWLLLRNPLWGYILFGFFIGFAYLAKPSTTPFVALFIWMSLLRVICCHFPSLPLALRAKDWKPWRFAVGILLVGLIQGAIILPRCLYSQERYGEPFYNAPGKWFWISEWSEAYPKYQLVRKQDLAKMSEDEQPTPTNFIKHHGWDFAWWKLGNGTFVRLQQLILPEETLRKKVEKRGKPRKVLLPFRGMYLGCSLILMLILLGFVLVKKRYDLLGPWAFPFVFIFGTFAAYTLAYGWFLGIGPGPRYIMSMYIPLFFFSMFAAHYLRRISADSFSDAIYLLAQIAPLVFIVPRLVSLFLRPEWERMLYAF
ncbi:MAG: hypothetical protein ACK5LK_03605 [Chthoniobacterales bacterium]